MFAAVTVVVGFAYTAIWVIAVVAYSGFAYAKLTADLAAVAYLGCIANFSVFAAVVVIVGLAIAIVVMEVAEAYCLCDS